MRSWEVLTAVLLVATLLAWWVWIVASRVDRLHRKVGASRVTLDQQLVRRATVAAELASSELMDPVSSVLVADAAWSALAFAGQATPTMVEVPQALAALVEGEGPPRGPGDGAGTGAATREEVESALSRTLRAALGSAQDVVRMRTTPAGSELLDELARAWYRIQLARRFHNEAVTQARRVRRKTVVRALRLAGHAPMPETFEIDDASPEAFGGNGPTAR